MAEITMLSKEEAVKIILEEKCDFLLLISHDLEKKRPIGKERIDKSRGTVLIGNSKTIILNKDEDEEDSFSILSLYTALQKDIFNINPRGIKHDMILVPCDLLE